MYCFGVWVGFFQGKFNSKSGVPLVLTLKLIIKISLMHVQQQEGDKKVIDYDDLDNSQAEWNIWGQWGFFFHLLLPNVFILFFSEGTVFIPTLKSVQLWNFKDGGS